jgi:protein SCO1/2
MLRNVTFPGSRRPISRPFVHARSALGALLAGLALACGVPSEEVYDVTGEVRDVDAAAGQIQIAHDDIADFMPAMTMSFDADPGTLEGVGAGDRIRFRLERSATLLRVTRIEVLEAGAGVGSGSLSSPIPDEAFDFRLIDEQGSGLALSDLRGQAVLLDFVFTRCPGPCPILTSSHVTLQRRLPPQLAGRIWFVSITVDPAFDTPLRLRQYALERGVDLARWSFLTGEPAVVEDVLRRYHVAARQSDGTLEHQVATFLIDPEGNIVERYLGLEHTPEQILADIERLL